MHVRALARTYIRGLRTHTNFEQSVAVDVDKSDINVFAGGILPCYLYGHHVGPAMGITKVKLILIC